MTISLSNVGSGFKRTALNANFEAIETELNNNVLRRDGLTGGANQMEVNLDMNSNDILNGGLASFTQVTVDGEILDPDNTGVTTLPTQTGNTGKHLVTNGSSALWETDGAVTLATAIASTTIGVGQSVCISDRAYGVFDVVLASGVTPNTYNIIQCTGIGTLALVLQTDGIRYLDQFGTLDGADATGAFQAALDLGGYIKGNGVYNVSGLDLYANTTLDLRGGGQIVRTDTLTQNLLVALGTSYSIPLENITVLGGIVDDQSASTISGVYFGFCKNLHIEGTKFIGMGNNNIDHGSIPNLDAGGVTGLAISSCEDATLINIVVEDFTGDGLLVAGGEESGVAQTQVPSNNIKVMGLTARNMAVSGFGTLRGATGVILDDFYVYNCGSTYSAVSLNSEGAIVTNGIIIGDSAVTYADGTYGLRVGHGWDTSTGFSRAPNSVISNVTIKDTGGGFVIGGSDGSILKNIKISSIDYIGGLVAQTDTLDIEVYIDTCAQYGVKAANSPNLTLRGAVKNTQLSGVYVDNSLVAIGAGSPEGMGNLDISMNITNFSLAALSTSEGGVYMSQSLLSSDNIKVHDCVFDNTVARYCIIHRHQKEEVSFYDNVAIAGTFDKFILAANDPRRASAAVWGNRLNTGEEIYPRVVKEAGRGTGATTAITIVATYGYWAELLYSGASFTYTASQVMTGGTNTSVITNFVASLSGTTMTYTFTGSGGTLSFDLHFDKLVVATP